MEDLLEYRKEIDEIDQEITNLFQRRMKISTQVAEVKIKTGKKVFDKSREEQKLKTLSEIGDNEFNRRGITELFSQIMAISRKKQYQLLEEQKVEEVSDFVKVSKLDCEGCKVVYQGLEGAYTHEAALKYFGSDVDCDHVECWRDAMDAIKNHQADYAVLPLENTTAGIVSDNYDLLVEYNNYIVGEVIIAIDHALLGTPDSTLEGIHTVYSHPQALMQCSHFLSEHKDWKQISVSNTAIAAKQVMKEMDASKAAIGSINAAKYHGLKILKEHIHHGLGNSTRFIVVSSKKIFRENAEKISICFEIPHISGSLYNTMSHFIYNDLNMTKIESRPIPNRHWEYHFFVDFEGNLSEAAVKNALRGIKEETTNFKILGNY